MNKVVLTGFEPFGKWKTNPSIEACRALKRVKIDKYSIQIFEIPLSFKKIPSIIQTIIETEQPQIMVCTGQSNRNRISLERVAINITDARIAYNCGTKPENRILEKDGPVAYWSSLPIYDILSRLSEKNIPAHISNTAGTFGCNQIFYEMMYRLEKLNKTIPAGFIHVPPAPNQAIGKSEVPSMSLDLTIEAIKTVIETTITQL